MKRVPALIDVADVIFVRNSWERFYRKKIICEKRWNSISRSDFCLLFNLTHMYVTYDEKSNWILCCCPISNRIWDLSVWGFMCSTRVLKSEIYDVVIISCLLSFRWICVWPYRPTWSFAFKVIVFMSLLTYIGYCDSFRVMVQLTYISISKLRWDER